jgi:uncharacterized protein YcbK (DUF882 family)
MRCLTFRHPLRDRRQFLRSCLTAVAGLAAAAKAAKAAIPDRVLTFENLHTGESLKATYWADGTYLRETTKAVAWVLRDFRNNTVHPIDPALLDLLYALQGQLEISRPFQVISGYRSPETNFALAAASDGVAKHSLHMQGMAIDIRIPKVELGHLRDAARQLALGGVGYYPASDFVHVDTGRIRHW